MASAESQHDRLVHDSSPLHSSLLPSVFIAQFVPFDLLLFLYIQIKPIMESSTKDALVEAHDASLSAPSGMTAEKTIHNTYDDKSGNDQRRGPPISGVNEDVEYLSGPKLALLLSSVFIGMFLVSLVGTAVDATEGFQS